MRNVIIILGCGNRPVQNSRVDRALEIYNKMNDAVIIPSGGRSKRAEISEAHDMKTYLISKGVPADVILPEPESANTFENLYNCRKMTDPKQDNITIVTSDYHIDRSRLIAYSLGYNNVKWVSSKSGHRFTHFFIEFFGIFYNIAVRPIIPSIFKETLINPRTPSAD